MNLLTQALGERGFRADPELAARIYQQAGRTLAPGAFGVFFVKQDALTYQPPAGTARSIHAVIRLVNSSDGSQGAEAAGAFKEGMLQSDGAFYGGHARYGSGPDFDRDYRIWMQNAEGVWQVIATHDVLEQRLKEEGQPLHRDAWAQFQHRVAEGTLEVEGNDQGNVYLNPENQFSNEFGGKLIYWCLNRDPNLHRATGRGGELAQTAPEDKKYHLWLFDGCRTQSYLSSIRATPGQDSGRTDILSTKRIPAFEDVPRSMIALLDSVLGQQSAEQAIRAMDQVNDTQNKETHGVRGNAIRGDGFEDNPVIK